jgi:hypothetical protein
LTPPQTPTPALDLAAQPRLVAVGVQPPDLRCYDRLLAGGAHGA